MFPNRLELLLSKKNMSKADFLHEFNLGKNSFSDWKRRGNSPNGDILAKIADYFGVSTDYLLGKTNIPHNIGLFPLGNTKMVEVIGEVKAGYNGIAFEEHLGFEPADVENPAEYRFFKVKGDSMSPKIEHGDFALVKLQSDVDSGDIAVAVYDGEVGTVKKVIKTDNAIILQPLNPNYETKIYTGIELQQVHIVGRVMEIKRKF